MGLTVRDNQPLSAKPLYAREALGKPRRDWDSARERATALFQRVYKGHYVIWNPELNRSELWIHMKEVAGDGRDQWHLKHFWEPGRPPGQLGEKDALEVAMFRRDGGMSDAEFDKWLETKEAQEMMEAARQDELRRLLAAEEGKRFATDPVALSRANHIDHETGELYQGLVWPVKTQLVKAVTS